MTVDYTDFDEVAHQDKLHFFYDEQNRPAKVEFNGTMYTYLHNVQGDIVGLLDGAGILMVEYKYDAWGKLLSATGALADTLGKCNPFRYRGYVYDGETGLYYLEARYYSTKWYRFLVSDQWTWQNNDLLSHNCFAYCSGNPIKYVDRNGMWLDIFFDAASFIGSIVEVIVNPADPIAWASLAADAVSLAVPGLTGGGRIVRFVCKADDVADAIKTADRVVDSGKAVRSTAQIGSQIHKAYRPVRNMAEGTAVVLNRTIRGTRLRPDGLDIIGRVVYELKPYNSRALKSGLRQAYKYVYTASKGQTKGWIIVVDMYFR